MFLDLPSPTREISANAVAIGISDTLEFILKYIIQGIAIKKMKIIPFSVMKIGFKKEEFKEMINYGSYVVGRTILSYFSEAGSFLWIILLSFTLRSTDTAEFVGYWNLAIGLVSAFLIATTMTRPIFPAISEAYIKDQKELIQQYCIRAAKWFYRWAIFVLAIYLVFGEHILRLISGDEWILSGQIIRVIAPAIFVKFGNEYLIGILNAIGKPKKVMIGTALKIPIMIFCFCMIFIISLFTVNPINELYGYYASTFFLMELVFSIYLIYQIKLVLKIKIKRHIWIIPSIVCFIGMVLPGYIFWRIYTPEERDVMKMLLMLLLYVALFLIGLLWSGGVEEQDFKELEDTLKEFMPNWMAEFLLKLSQGFAKLSPLYGKFYSEVKTKEELS